MENEFTPEQTRRSVTACKEFCCGECDYRVYCHEQYTLRCVRRLMIDVDKLLNKEDING